MKECPEGFVTRFCTIGSDFIMQLEVTAKTDPTRPFWVLQNRRHVVVAKIYTDSPSEPVITNNLAITAKELRNLMPQIVKKVATDAESFNNAFRKNIELLKKCS